MILWMLAAALVFGAAISAAQPAERTLTMNGTLLLQTGSEFAAGSTEGTVVLPEAAAPLRLASKSGRYLGQGVYLSPVVQTVPFSSLIISWNVDTPPGTAIVIEAQVLVEKKWSEWFSWGVWGDKAASADNPVSRVAQMDIDTLLLKGDKKATAIRYRLKLSSRDSRATPAVRLIALTIKDKDRIKARAALAEVGGAFERDLPVPPYSQARSDPKIASRICSPTSVRMVMAYHGIRVTPEAAAWGSYDSKGDLFGNWPFNAAYAAKSGLTAYVAFLDSLADLKQEIAQGYPVVAAVWYRSSESVAQPLPVLHGAPIDYTDGHLVVVRGFKVQDGKEYVLVNDPAGADEASVYREYLATEFETAWVKVAYIIRPGTGVPAPK